MNYYSIFRNLMGGGGEGSEWNPMKIIWLEEMNPDSYYILCVFVGTRDVSQLPHLQQVTNNFMSRSWMPLWAISATQISIKMANIKIKELFKGLQRRLCGLSTEINAANTKCHWMCLNSFVTVSTIVFPLFI